MKKEWIILQCLNAFRDAQGNPGQHKVPVPGYDTPMTREEARNALSKIEKLRPDDDFSARRIAEVKHFPRPKF